MKMYCKQCGAEIEDGARFCGVCGARQDREEQTAYQPVQSKTPRLSVADAIDSCFTHYFDFKGKSGKEEFRSFTVFAAVLCFLVEGCFYKLCTQSIRITASLFPWLSIDSLWKLVDIIPVIAAVFFLFLFIPWLAVLTRMYNGKNAGDSSTFYIVLTAALGILFGLFCFFSKALIDALIYFCIEIAEAIM